MSICSNSSINHRSSDCDAAAAAAPDLGSSISSASSTGAASTPVGKALSRGLDAKATPGAEEGAAGVAHRQVERGRLVEGCFIMGVESAVSVRDVVVGAGKVGGMRVIGVPVADWWTSLGACRSWSNGVAQALDVGAPSHTKHSGHPDLGSSTSGASTTSAASTPVGSALSWGLDAAAISGAAEGAEGVAHRQVERGRLVGGSFIMGVESAENFIDVG